uniref:Putative secreted peptide n=1 Tax=Anopheles braziliensis TaxID=58242 RepID=A0A2M3ZQ06_9DIPT
MASATATVALLTTTTSTVNIITKMATEQPPWTAPRRWTKSSTTQRKSSQSQMEPPRERWPSTGRPLRPQLQ